MRSTSPQNPDDVVVSVPGATAGDVAAAARLARTAQREWATATPAERSNALHAAATALAAAADELSAPA